jgi:hypothetical protein
MNDDIQSATLEARFREEVRKTVRIVRKLVPLARSALNSSNATRERIDPNQQLSNCSTDLYETFTATSREFPNHKKIETISLTEFPLLQHWRGPSIEGNARFNIGS